MINVSFSDIVKYYFAKVTRVFSWADCRSAIVPAAFFPGKEGNFTTVAHKDLEED